MELNNTMMATRVRSHMQQKAASGNTHLHQPSIVVEAAALVLLLLQWHLTVESGVPTKHPMMYGNSSFTM
eukprot:CAMPEP_0172918826 /NCGR_PEP_ID=MMETSP1075-20121228/200940_1 /TAXON_ID=2916 /ORGANISM="Ceratium fusus, Strain PA161109" /LENGTH=69 /DNA_ID=CAMNT_0013778557 /DNA_START=170 /DNA_END=379 /DNA_ORIENTATION=-